MNAHKNTLNITLPDGEVAHLIRVVVQNGEDGTGTIHCTVVRDNWDFEEILLDEAAACDAPKESSHTYQS